MVAIAVLGKILSVCLANAYRLCGETASVVMLNSVGIKNLKNVLQSVSQGTA